MKSTKFWVILTAVLLGASLAASILVLGSKTTSATVRIYQNGQAIRSFTLSEVAQPYSFTVDGPAGFNTIQVEPGRICVSHASCPDQICVKQGWISNGVTPIVCLPNRLVIQIESAGQGEDIDGVAR